jgi:hypothetical protein
VNEDGALGKASYSSEQFEVCGLEESTRFDQEAGGISFNTEHREDDVLP